MFISSAGASRKYSCPHGTRHSEYKARMDHALPSSHPDFRGDHSESAGLSCLKCRDRMDQRMDTDEERERRSEPAPGESVAKFLPCVSVCGCFPQLCQGLSHYPSSHTIQTRKGTMVEIQPELLKARLHGTWPQALHSNTLQNTLLIF